MTTTYVISVNAELSTQTELVKDFGTTIMCKYIAETLDKEVFDALSDAVGAFEAATYDDATGTSKVCPMKVIQVYDVRSDNTLAGRLGKLSNRNVDTEGIEFTLFFNKGAEIPKTLKTIKLYLNTQNYLTLKIAL